MKNNKFNKHIIFLGLMLLSPLVLASGSYNSGGRTAVVPQPRQVVAVDQTYNYGKKTVHKKLFCKGCPMSGVSLNKTSAKKVIENINKGAAETQKLGKKESTAAVYYLKKRFRI